MGFFAKETGKSARACVFEAIRHLLFGHLPGWLALLLAWNSSALTGLSFLIWPQYVFSKLRNKDVLGLSEKCWLIYQRKVRFLWHCVRYILVYSAVDADYLLNIQQPHLISLVI